MLRYANNLRVLNNWLVASLVYHVARLASGSIDIEYRVIDCDDLHIAHAKKVC